MNIKRLYCLIALMTLTTLPLAGRAQAVQLPSSTLPTVVAATGDPVTITVPSGARQSFAGFGTSLGNWGGEYQTLAPQERATLSRMLWRDLKFKTLRLWLNTYEYSPTPGAHDLSIFRRNYIDSGIIADARKFGVTTLLLAPDGLPDRMKIQPEKPGGDARLKESEVGNYAVLLADFIARLKAETGVQLDATGVQNEPNVTEFFSYAQMVAIVKRLRVELDARGLQAVKIIAPEYASSDGVFYEQVDALKNDAAAWQALGGVSSHSYNMAATDDIARRLGGSKGENLKEYWMTEASDNGPEEAGNSYRAASLAARFLNDMNHRVTHWIHFLGFEVTDPRDNATRIMAYTPNPLRTTIFQKYFTYQQLSNAFDVGAVFRDSQSTLEGDMTWTYGKKPRLTAAAAQNPDGSWAIGLVNYTADSFSGVQGWADEEWNKSQGGFTPAQTFPVTVRVDELKSRGSVPFTVHRGNNTLKNSAAGKVMMKNGEVTLAVAPLEVVTLRSTAVRGAGIPQMPAQK